MQTKRENKQGRLLLLPPLESFVPSDHRLRRLHQVLDLRFVQEAVRDRYCQDNGRPSIDPEVIIRLFLIQAIDGIAHVRELMRQVQVNLAYRWFIGYELDEALPDHSTLSRALDRLGDGVFNDLFGRSIAQCYQSGLIEGKVLHVDATTIRADISKDRVGRDDSSDPDARFGHFPGGKLEPGYKQQTVVDDRSQVIVGVEVLPANESEGSHALGVVDDAAARLQTYPEAVCADAAYGDGATAAGCEARGIRLVSPPRSSKTHTGDRYFSVEDFTYDEKTDEFVCPAGEHLRFIGFDAQRPDRRKYRARRSTCQGCRLKQQCTSSPQRQLKVGIHHAALRRLRADSQTKSFRVLYRRRAPVVEGVFAEAKQWHGLRRAWRRGLHKMLIQCLLVASVLNLKRLMAVLLAIFDVPKDTIQLIWCFLKTIGRHVMPNRRDVPCAATP
jgi:transposase